MMDDEQKLSMTAQYHDIPCYTRRCCITSGEQSTAAQQKQEILSTVQAEPASVSEDSITKDITKNKPIWKFAFQNYLRTYWKKAIRFCRKKLRTVAAFDMKSIKLPASFPIKMDEGKLKIDIDKQAVKQFLKEVIYYKSKTAAASVFVSLILVAFSLILAEFFSAGYDAYINGTYVATISEKSDLQTEIRQLNQQIVAATGEAGDIPVQVDYVFKFVPREKLSEDTEISRNLLAFSSRLKDAFVITVDSTPVTTVASLSDASASLEAVKEQYKNGQEDVTVEILNEIKVESGIVPTADISSVSTAAQSLNAQKSVDVDYIIQPEDSLWSLASENNLTVEDIQALNPGLEETLVDGSVIHLKQQQPLLNIKTVQNASYQETVPAPVNEIQDSNLYQGTTQVVEQGTEGLKMVSAKIVKINGQEVDRMVLSESVLSAPTPSSVIVGTRPVPTGIGSGQFLRPYSGVITSRFGSRWGSVHKGIDVGGSVGDPVLSADEGKVVFAGWNTGGYGNLVILDHGNGYQTYYAHMNEILVSDGDVIEKGYQLGTVGSTGRSTGPHLHFEVRKDGEPQDPQTYCY